MLAHTFTGFNREDGMAWWLPNRHHLMPPRKIVTKTLLVKIFHFDLCFDWNRACEDGFNDFFRPIFQAFGIPDLSLLNASMIAGIYLHPMNSQTSCLAFCAAKSSTKTIILKSKTCICYSSKFSLVSSNWTVVYFCFFNTWLGKAEN